MTLAFVYASGFATYWLWMRVVLRLFRMWVGGDRSERIRKDLFQGMKYDSLLKVRTALESEIAKRQP